MAKKSSWEYSLCETRTHAYTDNPHSIPFSENTDYLMNTWLKTYFYIRYLNTSGADFVWMILFC